MNISEWLEAGKPWNVILHADCMDIMKDIPDKSIDLILTDPPYGIGIDGQKLSICKNIKHNRKFHELKSWDKEPPPDDYFKQMFRISKNQIIFGANYFVEKIFSSKGWVIWDKGQYGLTMSDCEIIFTSFETPTRIFKMNRVELLKQNTIHPTEKPIKLLRQIIQNYSKPDDLIMDCFSGSGACACACYLEKRNFIAIEKDEDYYKSSVERLNTLRSQGTLF